MLGETQQFAWQLEFRNVPQRRIAALQEEVRLQAKAFGRLE